MSDGGDTNPLSCLLWILALAGIVWTVVVLATGH